MQDSIVVLKGQFLERMIPIAAGEPRGSIHLDGLYHRGSRRPSVVIAPPHPRAGGSMETTLVAELAWALTRAGHATLRFNYRGVGASQGEIGDEEADRLDVLSVLSHLSETEGGRIALCGVGHGALACLRVAAEQPRIDSVAIFCPLPSMDEGARALTALLHREAGAPRLLVVTGGPPTPGWMGAGSVASEEGFEVFVVDDAEDGFAKGWPQAARRVAQFYREG